jgi:4-amino-4-deoxy-L-arabinose transferase-like glycosyltransferase
MNPAATAQLLDSALAPPSRSRFRLFLQSKKLVRPWVAAGLLLILGFGATLRIWSTYTYTKEGQDEHLYAIYVNSIQRNGGLSHYGKVIALNVEWQETWSQAFVPATRIGFIWPAYLCFKAFGLNPLQSLRIVSCTGGILLLLLAARIGWHVGGETGMLGLAALMSTAPLHVYLAQRCLVDAYFAFWAVLVFWLMWKNLRTDKHWGWLTAYGLSLTVLVLTKENAAFVVLAVLGVLMLSRRFRLGQARPELVIITLIAPAIAVGILAALMGGIGAFVDFFHLFAEKNRMSDYSVLAQDGPWYRYLVDFTMISPLPLVLAMGAIFQLRSNEKLMTVMTLLLGLSFAVMLWVPNGMSLRYAAYWDVPLRCLALTQIFFLSKKISKLSPALVCAGLLVIVCASDLWEYHRYFVRGHVYDPISNDMMFAAGMAKEDTRRH